MWRLWTEDEDRVLRQIYPDPHFTRDDMICRFGRSFPAIQTRARTHFGLRRHRGAGQSNPNWQGGRRITEQGYVEVRLDHPRAHGSSGYVFEHILVWEQAHGRPLPKGWIVHHINDVKDDNRSENLEAMPRGVHRRVYMSGYDKLVDELWKKVVELELENIQLKVALGETQAI